MSRFNLVRVVVCATLSPIPLAAQTVDAVGPGDKALSAARFADMRGEYRMDDGSVLTIEGARLRPMARVDARAAVPLRAAGPDRLVSADGLWQLEFRSHGDRFDAVRLTMPLAAR